MPIIVKKNVRELVNKQALTKEIHNELLSQFDKQTLTNALKQEIKNEIKSELDNLLSGSELQSELQNALMLEADVLNNKMKIENEIAYNLKRRTYTRWQARR
ncbi:hypothetical protein VN0768_05640 [Helicobacter pylori]